MLTRLDIHRFTVFARANFSFSSGLNVIVGENGTGKSHLLKLAYTLSHVMATGGRESGSAAPTKSYLESALARKLRGVFRPDELGRLAHRKRGGNRCKIVAKLDGVGGLLDFSFHSKSKTEVTIDSTPTKWLALSPVFLPTRELLTIYPGFVSLYDTTELPFEETWRDTCLLLGKPLARGPRLSSINDLLNPLEEQLGGRVDLVEGRFYVTLPSGITEAHLVAEGLRKLAMVARLIATGSLTRNGSLYWDEPEANLNPKLIKQVARTILQLCQAGIQVFVATHSLFLMRELDILLKTTDFQGTEARFFGLHPSDGGVEVQQGETVDDIGTIVALDQELVQSDRYLSIGE